MQNIFNALSSCDFVHLQSLTLRFCSQHAPPPWTMDPVLVMNLLRQNPSLRYVNLELPIPAATITEGLGLLSQLDTLVTRRWKDSENTRSRTGAVNIPESPEVLFPSLCNINSDCMPTLLRTVLYPSSLHHLATDLALFFHRSEGTV
ncbi:hypothetical protein FRB94_003363 [Tulasnella sp. JGI-2019a]|nr:hypothetical protein FRB94_003363 [Tulasnella sp. JGI-2019a]KAG9025102.1 hypothetical protein FRB95_010575 [Tulasnella sp. JGI-2019a]